jgi:hypothetical protein
MDKRASHIDVPKISERGTTMLSFQARVKARLTRLLPLLLALGLVTATAVTAQVAVSPPTLAATCSDGSNWGSPLLGSTWSSSFTGVPVYSNGSNPYYVSPCIDSVTLSNGNVVTAGTEWQCVELVNRLYLTKGWITSHWYGDGNTLIYGQDSNGVDHGMPAGLTAQYQNSITSIVPGDVVTLNGPKSDPAGHAGIVSSVTPDGPNYEVTIVNQNQLDSGYYDYAMWNPSAGTLSAEYPGYSTQAVIHAAGNKATDGGSSTPPSVPSSNSGVVYNPSTNFLMVFARGPGDSLNASWDTVGQPWNGPAAIAGSGTTFSNPAVVYNPSTNFVQVFVQGPDNSLDTYWDTVGQPWNGPATIAGDGTTFSNPAAVLVQSTNFLMVFVQGPGNSLNTYWETIAEPWNGPSTLGGSGTTYSDPTAVLNQTTGFIQVFAKGSSDSLDTYWDTIGQPWNGPAAIAGSGTTYSDPVPIYNPSTNFVMVFAQGPGNSLNASWDTVGQPWNGPAAIAGDGTTYSDPVPIYNPSTNFLMVFAQGAGNSLNASWDTVGQPWNGPAAIAGDGTTYSSPGE